MIRSCAGHTLLRDVSRQDAWKSHDSEQSIRRNSSTVLFWGCLPLACLLHKVSTSHIFGLHH